MGRKLIELKNIVKIFPGVVANDNVNLSINKGEIHAIVGENGAGKSTLLKTIYGLHQPTSGEIYFDGKRVEISNPTQAIKMGIGMVHQHFMLVPSFTVAENIVMGSEPRKNKFFTDFKRAKQITEELVAEYGLKVDAAEQVKDVSVGIQQRIEILKTLYRGADVLILDEPTAVLTPQETKELFKVIRNLVNEKEKTVIFITHKLQEVMDISDRVSVMRDGKLLDTMMTEKATKAKMAELMVGREVLLEELNREDKNGETNLTVKNIRARNNRGLIALNGVSLSLKSGEILGIAGVEGNGQAELIEVLAGLRELEEGEFYIKDTNASDKSPWEIRELGVAHIPEDRLKNGLSEEATLVENLLMGLQYQEPYAKYGIHLNNKAIKQRAEQLIKEYDVRTPSAQIKASSLSGGNMQKLVVAREFSFEQPILLISQPTRGIDIGAIEFIHEQIIQKRNEGCAILLVSAELNEIMRLSDRIITIYEGEITGEFINDGSLSKQEIGLYMTGQRGERK